MTEPRGVRGGDPAPPSALRTALGALLWGVFYVGIAVSLVVLARAGQSFIYQGF